MRIRSGPRLSFIDGRSVQVLADYIVGAPTGKFRFLRPTRLRPPTLLDLQLVGIYIPTWVPFWVGESTILAGAFPQHTEHLENSNITGYGTAHLGSFIAFDPMSQTHREVFHPLVYSLRQRR